MDVLRGTGLFVLLTATLPELARRVRAADRPRVNPGVSLEEDLQKIWSQSVDKYRAAADLTVDTDGKDIEETVAELRPLLRAVLGTAA